MRTPGIAGKQAKGKKKEWMWISLCIFHAKQLVYSADISFKEHFAPLNGCTRPTALEKSWVPTLPQGKRKSRPALEEGC